MANTISFEETKKNKIDELNREIEIALQKSEENAEKMKNGYKPATKEEAAELVKDMLRPGELMKKRAKLLGDRNFKSSLEMLEEKLDTLSDKEIESGLMVVR